MQNKLKILIVDDCLEDRQAYCRYLSQDEKYNYIFVEQEYGENGLEACKQIEPDIILLDYMLPDMDGLEFLEELKADRNSSKASVVMLTGEGSEKVAVQAMKYGVEDYLVKGDTTAETLRVVVRNVVEKAVLQQELEASKQRFFTSVENMLDCFGIYICIRDNSGKIVGFHSEYLNAAASEHSLIGLQKQSTLQEKELFEQYRQVVETGVPISTEVLCFASDNEEKIVIQAFDMRISKLEDGFVATWRDITKRKQSEKILQESQYLIQQIADTTPDILYLYS
ncbi:MAG: response regulator [Cyanobacteriota bacterium]|nr:response regulator [Cyanobacteriota bacterium]